MELSFFTLLFLDRWVEWARVRTEGPQWVLHVFVVAGRWVGGKGKYCGNGGLGGVRWDSDR